MSKEKKLKKVLQIVIPIIIVSVIVVMWITKNSSDTETEIPTGNADFALNATSLDIEKLKSYGLPIIIDFGADSCLPCKEMAPVLKKLNEEYKGKAIIIFVDVWKYQQLADGFPVEVIPTQIFIDKDGKPYVPSDPEGMKMIMYSLRDTNEHVFTAHKGGMTEAQLVAVLKEMGVER